MVSATRATLLLLALSLSACGTSAQGDHSTADAVVDTRTDVPTFDAATETTENSDGAGAGADSGEDDAPDATLLASGEPCQTDDECESDFCVTIDAGDSLAICSERCVDTDDRAEGSERVRLGGGGADVESVCLATDFCLDPDADGHGLGPGCESDDCDESDPGRYVNATEVCDGIDNDRDDEIDNGISAVGDLCESGFPGACSEGFYDCDAGLLECRSRTVASAETCNGIDEDCNGEADEDEAGEPLSRECYVGSEETLNVGLCVAGQEVCSEAHYTSCSGQVLPTAELCNGDDDDCDGEADVGGPESGGACTTGGSGFALQAFESAPRVPFVVPRWSRRSRNSATSKTTIATARPMRPRMAATSNVFAIPGSWRLAESVNAPMELRSVRPASSAPATTNSCRPSRSATV